MRGFKRLFFLPLSFFLLLWSFGTYSKTEGQKIDAQIEELEEQKRGYEGRALRHEYMAEYMQFNDKTVLETRKHIKLAEENRMKAALVQEQIDILKAKRARLK